MTREVKKRPKSIGSYIIGKTLGTGGNGTVYLCKHKGTKQKYAGKLFDAESLNPDRIHNINREVEILKKLFHENTVSFVELVFSRHGFLLVMELVNGTDLSLKNGVPEPKARKLFIQLLEAIKYLHSQRIVHLDIKVENVIRDKKGTLKLVDYGHAEQIPEHIYEREGFSVRGQFGTRYCYPPEVMSAVENKNVSFARFQGDKVDIWTAGIFLYALIAVQDPFRGEDEEEEAQEAIEGNVWYEDVNFSPELEDLLRFILKRKPSERPSIEEILGHPWVQNGPLGDKKSTVFKIMTGKAQEFARRARQRIASRLTRILNLNSR